MSGPDTRKQKGAPCAIPHAELRAVPRPASQLEPLLPVPMSASGSASTRVVMGSE